MFQEAPQFLGEKQAEIAGVHVSYCSKGSRSRSSLQNAPTAIAGGMSMAQGVGEQDTRPSSSKRGHEGPFFGFLAERVGLSLRDQACGFAAAPVEQGPSSSTTLGEKNKKGPRALFIFLAERVGFEPTKGYKPLLVFKTSAFNRSATSPNCLLRSSWTSALTRAIPGARPAGALRASQSAILPIGQPLCHLSGIAIVRRHCACWLGAFQHGVCEFREPSVIRPV